MHPGVEPADVQEATGWELRIADPVEHTEPPSRHEVEALRELRASAGR